MKYDLINDAIVAIKNGERIGKDECRVRPTSKLLIQILQVFQREGYIDEFEYFDDAKGGEIRISLKKLINDCGVIKPRYPIKYQEIHNWESRYLPARGVGALVLSTPEGIISHKEAKEKKIGGRLLVYVY